MSTEFRTADTDEWAFTRWGRSPEMGVDFGSRTRFARVVTFCMSSDVEFVGEDGSTADSADVVRLAFAHRFPVSADREVPAVPTFGEFVGTVEVGSGEMFDRMGLDDD